MYLSLTWSLFTFVEGQQCGANDYVISKNNQTYFTIFANNQTCACSSFVGSGSQLTGLENQPIVKNLISQVNSLLNSSTMQSIQINNLLNLATMQQDRIGALQFGSSLSWSAYDAGNTA